MGILFSTFLPDDDATNRFGRHFGPVVSAGDIILLEGEIGTGKTHFARALIQERLRLDGLPNSHVPSPTYTLVQTYNAATYEIWHADLYRLGDASEVAELGLDAAFEDQICLVEWPEKLEIRPVQALTIEFETAQDGRKITVNATDERWVLLSNSLEAWDA